MSERVVDHGHDNGPQPHTDFPWGVGPRWLQCETPDCGRPGEKLSIEEMRARMGANGQ